MNCLRWMETRRGAKSRSRRAATLLAEAYVDGGAILPPQTSTHIVITVFLTATLEAIVRTYMLDARTQIGFHFK